GYVQRFRVGDQDTIWRHYYDSLRTKATPTPHYSVYDLCVSYRIIRDTLIYDTICPGDSVAFDRHWFKINNNITQIQYLKEPGIYRDTMTAVNGCDSIITLYLAMRDRIPVAHRTVHIPDTLSPFLWLHEWTENGNPKDSTEVLSATGEYRFVMPSVYGCDSIDSLSLRIHNTYKIQEEDIIICASETPYKWQDRNDITKTCDLEFHTLTHDGYDSIRYVHITVLPVVKGAVLIDTICEGDSIRWGLTKQNTPRFLTKTGVYYDTLTSHQYGCDSIIELRLNVYPRYNRYSIVDIADKELPYTWEHKQGGTVIDTDILGGPGTFGYTFTTAYGCDSIDSLTLRVHTTYNLVNDTINICSNEVPYSWNGLMDITSTGDYTFYGQTSEHYDSIVSVHINVWPMTYDTLYAHICEGDSMRWGLTKQNTPRFLTKTGTYNDTLTTIHGCDSIRVLRLTVYPQYNRHSVVDIADKELPYTWEHKQGGTVIDTDILEGPGTFGYTFTTAYGCDSIDSLTLRVHTTYNLVNDTINICSTEVPYSWNGLMDITTTGDYTFYGQTSEHYDSIVSVHINVWPVLYDTLRMTICEGDSVRWGLTKQNTPRFLTKTGTYNDTLLTEHGCDSIRVLHLSVYPTYRRHQTVDIADTELPYTWVHRQGGTQIASELLAGAGEYGYTFKTAFGCDSIDSLTLRVHETYSIHEDDIDICSDATPFTWANYTNIVRTGDYTFNGQTQDGYDSIRTVHINVWPVQYTTIRHTMCQGEKYIFGSKQLALTEGGQYYDTLATTHGCDSIVTLILKVNQPYFNTRTEHIIEGNSIEWFGATYSTSGSYTHYNKTPEGCDSTSILQLVVHPLIDTTVTVCKSALPYQWVNKWTGQVTPLYRAGVYRNDTTYDAEGNRLFYGLQLIVNEPTDSTIFRTICADEKYDFHGKQLTKSGEYRDTLRNSVGCDSMVILQLTVLPKYYHVVERTIYEGDTVHFQDQVYSTAGIYPFRYTSSFGCDSVIELRLTVNRLYDDSVSICSNDLPYVWRGKEILESGLYRDTLIDSEGRPSVIGIQVTVLPTARLEEPLSKSICEGTEYLFGGRILTTPGTYYDTLTAKNGCDSIVALVLQVEPRHTQTDYKTIFEGDSVEFYGEWYKQSGQYEHKTINALGCEDSHILVVTVLKASNIDTTAYICKNDLPFIWHGHEYNESGDFTLPITWNDSVRVTMTLHLVVHENYYSEQNISLCEGDTIIYKNRQYYSNGIFYDTIPSRVGCDSIIKYIVSIHPTYDRIIEKHISDDSVFVWHDRPLSLTGSYEWTGKTIHGCDSIEHLTLTVHPSFFKSDTIDLCQSDSLHYPYKWVAEDGRVIASITETGVYNDSVLTAYGFDSVHQLVVYVHPAYLIREQYEIGEGEVLKIHGRDISQPAVYYDTLRTIHGCDSIFYVVVNQKRTREFTWTKEICQGEYFDFFGRKLTHTGKYVYTSQYKDSIVTLMLTVNPISITEERIVITDKQIPYIYDGRIYEASGVYADTMLNHLGCDSIHRVVLVVSSRYSDWDPIPLCPGAEIKIDGQVITESGLYTFLRRSRVTGEMDSIYRVEVYDAPAYDMPTQVRTICDGDTIFIGGKAVTRAGHYDFALKTREGCDSLLHLDLTVNPSYHYFTDATIRDFESYTWMGKTYSEEGNYDRTWPTILDCDSTYTLRLKVIPTQRFLTVDTICEGQTYTWRGKTFNTDGYHTDTVYRKETFFSAIYTLQLTVMHPTFISKAQIHDICADDEFFDISFTYTGAKPTTYSIYFDQLAKDEGFVDVINKPFLGEDHIARAPVPSKKEVVYLDHTAYVKPNKYSMRMVLDNGVCGKSQSDSLVVLVKYPSWIIEQNWNDVVAPLKKTYNGGYEFSQVSWYVNGTLQPNNGLGYLQNNHFKDGDEVVMEATRKGESYSIPTCPLIIKLNTGTTYEDPILVYPTKVARYAPRVTIEAPQSGEYAIYSSTGSSAGRGTFEQGKTQVTLPSVNGIYILRLKQGEKVETQKVIVY
ncbi:MAG: T9SS type A sorting domain-containing protein, partial [Paludibacteraceae bacterium]|nr:T9SS type A sorting domain-containing protein [Paludibacteraceae bacterium]